MILGRLHFNGVVDDVVAVACVLKATYLGTVINTVDVVDMSMLSYYSTQ